MYEDDSDLIPRNSQIYVTMMTRSARATSKRSKTVVSKVEEEQQELSEKPEASVEDQDDDENNADKDEIKDNNDNNVWYMFKSRALRPSKEVSTRKIVNALNQNNKKVIISIKCATKELDVRIPGRKWRGWIPAKEEFEKNLINDFC